MKKVTINDREWVISIDVTPGRFKETRLQPADPPEIELYLTDERGNDAPDEVYMKAYSTNEVKDAIDEANREA